jgi:hypothetical protein
MTNLSRADFHLEDLQPEWLPEHWWLPLTYVIVDRGFGGLVIALIVAALATPTFLVEYAYDGASMDALTIGEIAIAFLVAVVLLTVPVWTVAGAMGGRSSSETSIQRRLRDTGQLIGILVFTFVILDLPKIVASHFGFELGPPWADLVMTLQGLDVLCGFVLVPVAFVAGGPGLRPRHVALAETIGFSMSKALATVLWCLRWGLVVVSAAAGMSIVAAFVNGATMGDAVDFATYETSFILFLTLIAVVLLGCLGGLVIGERDIRLRVVPNEGVVRTANQALRVSVGTGLIGGLVFGVVQAHGAVVPAEPIDSLRLLFRAYLVGVLFALVSWLAAGGYACMSHAALRLVLWKSGALPLRIASFLDSAVECQLLYRVGGGYRFYHQLVQEYFARAALEVSAHGDAGTLPAVATFD